MSAVDMNSSQIPPPFPEQKRMSREEKRREREQLKLQLMEAAKNEVELQENQLLTLQSLHRQCSDAKNWQLLAFSLPPFQPAFASTKHLEATLTSHFSPPGQQQQSEQTLEAAWEMDLASHQTNIDQYAKEYEQWSRQKDLAKRVLGGDISAYSAAVQEFFCTADIALWGDAFSFLANDSQRAECHFPIKGEDIIPSEIKTLTSGGKLSSKRLPKARHRELYQNHISSFCLKIGRELFALLPLQEIKVTATVLMLDPSTGNDIRQPVMSVRFDRKTMNSLNFERVNPIDVLNNFSHLGFSKELSKNDQLLSLDPIASTGLERPIAGTNYFHESLGAVQRLRKILELPASSRRNSRVDSFAETINR
jgi:hypothetical protein